MISRFNKALKEFLFKSKISKIEESLLQMFIESIFIERKSNNLQVTYLFLSLFSDLFNMFSGYGFKLFGTLFYRREISIFLLLIFKFLI